MCSFAARCCETIGGTEQEFLDSVGITYLELRCDYEAPAAELVTSITSLPHQLLRAWEVFLVTVA